MCRINESIEQYKCHLFILLLLSKNKFDERSDNSKMKKLIMREEDYVKTGSVCDSVISIY